MVVIFTLFIGKQGTTRETVLLRLCKIGFLLQPSSVTKRSLTLSANSVNLESMLMASCPDYHILKYANRPSLLQFRKEWEALRVACLTKNIPDLFRFLASCITCVVVVLRFDHRVVKALQHLSSLP